MVTKKYTIRQQIKYYQIIPYLIFGIILALTEPYIFQLVCNMYHLDYRNPLFTLLAYAVPLGIAALWIYAFFSNIRSKRYTRLTGRKYESDHIRYKRSYTQLVDYFKDADSYQIDPDTLPQTNWKDAEGIILVRTKNGHLIHINSSKDGQITWVLGNPGVGKTAGPIITSAMRWGARTPLSEASQKTNGSVFCIDLKNDIWKATHKYRSIKRFNLMDPEHSCHFNPLNGIEELSIDDRCNFIENMAYNIIPAPADASASYFFETAVDYFVGAFLYCLDKDITLSFPDICKKILVGNPIDWVLDVMIDGCIESKQKLANKFGENEKNLSGGYSLCCRSVLKLINNKTSLLLGNDPHYEYISPQMLEDGYDVYIQLDQIELANYSSLLCLITQTFISAQLDRENNPNAGRLSDGTLRPCLYILDEFAQLTTLSYDMIKTFFMTGRSRALSSMCALQSRSSIAEMFHSENACKSLIDCVSTFCFLSIQEVETRKWASDLIGTHKVLKISNNIQDGTQSSGRSVSETREPIVFPEEFGSLKDPANGKDELIIYSIGKYIRAEKQYYFK